MDTKNCFRNVLMSSLVWIIISHMFYGCTDSVRGLWFITELDKDEEYVAVNTVQRIAPRTVLQQRREQRGTVFKPAEPIYRRRERVWKRVGQCLGMNSLIVILIAIFSKLVQGVLHLSSSTDDKALSRFLDVSSKFIVVPIFLFTRIILALWSSDIAGACLRNLNLPPPRKVEFSMALADLLISVLLGFVFLAQGLVVVYLPLPSVLCSAISFIHMSLLNSMYCFEYFWSSRSVSLPERIRRLESQWPYFIGFGAILALASSLSSDVLWNGCAFGALFPLFIISSYKANWIRGSEDSSKIPVVKIFTPSRLITDRFAKSLTDLLIS